MKEQQSSGLNAARFEEPSSFMNGNPNLPLEGKWWVWLTLIGTGVAALGVVIVPCRRRDRSSAKKTKLSRISTQVEVLEAFSQRIFHSVVADDILWGIAAQSVESLSFDQCAIYTRSENKQHWERRAPRSPRFADA